ncbi:MAG: hypothetical protein SPL73_02690 [Cyanobacteriota bacterium]|nr:hypothetical protein [Cyanobacteriota bacterium]MDY6358206.1 hypothetical protein [Cyanobacteriota bacterium]MDY6363778.1 hypothetical protein [Cyanobacteriota bacterium]MDY6382390.1 hypothetical protein [Cyanobacteriota bacterium]
MKKLLLIVIAIMLGVGFVSSDTYAAPITSGSYRHEQNKIARGEVKQIKKLFELHSAFANKHDIAGLKGLYDDNYINSDGFDKKSYFKTVEETWEECKDLIYATHILSITLNGNYADVSVEERALGTTFDKVDSLAVAGEIHAVSTSIYHLVRKNGKWLISGETMQSDKSYLLYGDARFMNIDLSAPNQVAAGETYTITVSADADEDTVIIGSIEHDPVTYPSVTPNAPLRTMPSSNVLERFIKANNDNINEYAVASLAISKSQTDKFDNFRVYMAGLACIMQRVNVVPKNNFIKYEDEKK